MTAVRFDDAEKVVRNFLSTFATTQGLFEVGAIRDLAGVFRFAIDGNDSAVKALDDELVRLEPQLGAWLAKTSASNRTKYGRVLRKAELFDAPQVFGSRDRMEVCPRAFLLDRRVVAADWRRGPLPNQDPKPSRATFFALKGGAGRSTALLYWARHLARTREKRVLVVDLDLESPGISAALLAAKPRFGVVDWYVEDAIGQADADLLAQMTADSPLASGAKGSIVVAPVAGEATTDYLAKLARVYASPPGTGDAGAFGERTARLIDALEAQVGPDVTVIDSRAGLHDVGAVTVVRLGATSFLFATETKENWLGYEYMFEAWGRQPNVLEQFREDLRVVASLVPETGADLYLDRLRDRAHDLFANRIYENQSASQTGFNFGRDSVEGPHFAIPVRWNRQFFAHDPTATQYDPSLENLIEASFGDFFRRADELVLQ
jgi:hypothetical protein